MRAAKKGLDGLHGAGVEGARTRGARRTSIRRAPSSFGGNGRGGTCGGPFSRMRKAPQLPARTARTGVAPRERTRCPVCYAVVRVTRARTFGRHDVTEWRARTPGGGIYDPVRVECGSSRQPLSLEAEAGDEWAIP